MAGARNAAGWRQGMAWTAMLLLVLLCTTTSVLARQSPVHPDRDYLLVGASASDPAPERACSAEARTRLSKSVEIPPPAGGWPGTPQAVEVFNVFAGEVMISHRDRQVCGHMQDARTRDSRFRAGVGMVMVPVKGDVEPIRVAWERQLKAHWIPTVRLGAPSPVQQIDTQRLLFRTACIAIALALALSALMGFIATRDRDFLVYTVATALLVIWQAVLSGLSGYPRPWLPVTGFAHWWLVSTSMLSIVVMGWVLWRMCGGLRIWSGSRLWVRGLAQLTLVLVLLTPLLPWAVLTLLAGTLDPVFVLVCLLVLVAGVVSLLRGDRRAVEGIAAVVPLLLMALMSLFGSSELMRFRVEAVQLSVTWFLMMYAYGVNRSLGQLRQQRDEMRHLADTDTLTGVPNRRAGLRQLERYVTAARATGQPLSIGFIDIDLFKQINDRYGHDVGDEVLVLVARVLASGVRGKFDVIRMGGEEFLLLLPGCGTDVALPRMENLREKITSKAQELRHEGLQVTASIGLAELQDSDDDVASLLRRADIAMYRAKRGGRNRVVDARTELDVA